MGSQAGGDEEVINMGANGSEDLMLSVGSEPGQVVALHQLRLGWRKEERTHTLRMEGEEQKTSM